MSKEDVKTSYEINRFNPLDLLIKFKSILENGKEQSFIQGNTRVNGSFNKLYKEFDEANEKKKRTKSDKGISEFLDWHQVHMYARDFWTDLMSAAINHIDPSSKGNSELYDYLDDSSKFEDVLYGLESYYRDHTLHSVWVYLMGVQLMSSDGELSFIPEKLNWYLFNDIETGANRYPYPPLLNKWAVLREDIFKHQLKNYREAVWCIIALCHDLGYSLAKLNKLNKRVLDVLKYFHISDFNRVGYSLDIEHQYLVEQFLEIMAMDVRIVPGEEFQELSDNKILDKYAKVVSIDQILSELKSDIGGDLSKKIMDLIDKKDTEKGSIIDEIGNIYSENPNKNTIIGIIKDFEEKTLVKCYRDDSTYWRLCNALERKEHGILSAYLIYKILGIFADTSIRGSAEEWGLEDQEVIYNIIRGDILFAIAQHEFAYTHINQLGSLAEVLILCDELEEFTRLGRKLQSREYTDTTAETGVRITKISPLPNENDKVIGDYLKIELVYDSQHKEPEDFLHFFWRKLRRICTLYSLDQPKDEYEKVYFPIKEISVYFKYLKNEYLSSLKMVGSKIQFTSDLPKKVPAGKLIPAEVFKKTKNYNLMCVDDRIYIQQDDSDENLTTLRDWFNIKD